MNPNKSPCLRSVILACALTGAFGAVSSAYAAHPVVELKGPAKPSTRSWFGVNTGLVGGSVELPCPPGTPGDCGEGGVFATWGVNVTVVGKMALRLRAMRAEEEGTDHKPYEMAVLFGTRLGRSHWYGLIGPGRIVHPDDEYEGSVTGLAWEFVRARPTNSGIGFEFSVYGNSLGDATFSGVALGARFGKLR